MEKEKIMKILSELEIPNEFGEWVFDMNESHSKLRIRHDGGTHMFIPFIQIEDVDFDLITLDIVTKYNVITLWKTFMNLYFKVVN